MGLFDFWRAGAALPAPETRTEPPMEASPAPGAEPEAPRVRAAVQEAGGGILIATPDQLEQYLRQGVEGTASGQRVTPDTALSEAAVYACVRIIAGAVATLPLDIKRRIDERTREDLSDHPVYRVLRRRPNRWMKPAKFRRMAQAHTLAELQRYSQKETAPVGKLAMAYGAVLRYAGARVDDDEVYSGLFTSGAPQQAIMQSITVLLAMMVGYGDGGCI